MVVPFFISSVIFMTVSSFISKFVPDNKLVIKVIWDKTSCSIKIMASILDLYFGQLFWNLLKEYIHLNMSNIFYGYIF